MCCTAYGKYLEAGRVRGKSAVSTVLALLSTKPIAETADGRKIVASLGDSIKARAAARLGAGGHGGSHVICAETSSTQS